jgi:hypothetical protein
VNLSFIAQALAAAGLAARGGFHPEPGDGVPGLPEGRPAGTVVLAGTIGGASWAAFRRSPEAGDGGADPLDRWSRRVLCGVARDSGAHPLFPFEEPHLPFQRWAMRAEPVAPSPLGILIHPDYGLWHAYRGALAFARRIELPPPDRRARPCDSCALRPCLVACPVGAFQPAGYDALACIAHLDAPAGADCMALSCRARRACPVGAGYRYGAEASAFHMAAFRAAGRRAAQTAR